MTAARLLLGLGVASLAACELAELETPQTGSCDAATSKNSWPQFAGNDGKAPELTNVGWNQGQVPPDFRLTDQFGDPVCLWQMVGKWVVMDSSTLWCIPCQQIAETVKCQAEEYGDELVYMTFIVEDVDAAEAEPDDAALWANQYDLSSGTQTPVLSDGQELVSSNFPGANQQFPALLVLNPSLELEFSGLGATAEASVKGILDEALGAPSRECAHSE